MGLTNGYASAILADRLGYNEMSWRQWAAAFLHWTHGRDEKLFTQLFGQETRRYFHGFDKRVRRMARETRAEFAASGVSKEDQLALVMARVWDNLPKHLAVSVPLAWRGMQPSKARYVEPYSRAGERAVLRPSILPDPWFSIACWLLLVIALVRGTRQNRSVLLALLFCPAVILAINALVSMNVSRYNIGLVTPLSVGTALPIVWFMDAAWNGLRRRGRMGHSAPTRTVVERATEGAGGSIDAGRKSLGRGP